MSTRATAPAVVSPDLLLDVFDLPISSRDCGSFRRSTSTAWLACVT